MTLEAQAVLMLSWSALVVSILRPGSGLWQTRHPAANSMQHWHMQHWQTLSLTSRVTALSNASRARMRRRMGTPAVKTAGATGAGGKHAASPSAPLAPSTSAVDLRADARADVTRTRTGLPMMCVSVPWPLLAPAASLPIDSTVIVCSPASARRALQVRAECQHATPGRWLRSCLERSPARQHACTYRQAGRAHMACACGHTCLAHS